MVWENAKVERMNNPIMDIQEPKNNHVFMRAIEGQGTSFDNPNYFKGDH
jgi:hypothetical protein